MFYTLNSALHQCAAAAGKRGCEGRMAGLQESRRVYTIISAFVASVNNMQSSMCVWEQSNYGDIF